MASGSFWDWPDSLGPFILQAREAVKISQTTELPRERSTMSSHQEEIDQWSCLGNSEACWPLWKRSHLERILQTVELLAGCVIHYDPFFQLWGTIPQTGMDTWCICLWAISTLVSDPSSTFLEIIPIKHTGLPKWIWCCPSLVCSQVTAGVSRCLFLSA